MYLAPDLALNARQRMLAVALLPPLIAVLIAIGGSIPFFVGRDLTDDSVSRTWLWTGLLSGGIVLVFKRRQRLSWMAPSMVYLTVFWVFHFGTTFPASIFPEVVDGVPPWTIGWLYLNETQSALLMSLAFTASFCIGASLLPKSECRVRISGDDWPLTRELTTMGWLVLLGGFLMAAAFVAQNGFAAFAESYENYFEVHNAFSFAIVIMTFGLCMQLAGGRPVRSVLVTCLFCLIPLALMSFLAGARTAPLFSASVLACVFYKRGVRIPGALVLSGVLIMLTMISTVRELRQYGLGSVLATGSPLEIGNPILGLTELGGSLHSVSATIQYMETRTFMYGGTYLYPFSRQLATFSATDKDSMITDERFIANRINSIYGPIGYSVVAESYANGGVLFVALVGIIWGVTVSLFEAHSRNPYWLALSAAILIPMMHHIRNTFLYVPAWIFMGSVPVLLAWLWSKKSIHNWRTGQTDEDRQYT